MYSVIAKDPFRQELYREHLEEAAFLYEQRKNLLADDEVEWVRVGDFEERFQAHLDGLAVGGSVALEVAEVRAMEGEPGELHAAIRLFCRQRCKPTVLKLLDGLDPAAPARVDALSDALREELPNAWQEELLTGFRANPRKLAPAVMATLVTRRLMAPPDLADALQAMAGGALLEILRILGRTGDRAATGLLAPYARREPPAVREQATIALLRLGDDETRQWLAGLAPSESWAAMPLALCGGPAAVEWLLRGKAAGGATQDFCRGLGLLGDVRGMEALIAALDDSEAAESAAKALDDITGAVSSGAGAASGSATARGRTAGKPARGLRKKDALDSASWKKWWERNHGDFIPGLRYHGGRLASLAVVLEQLASPRATCRDRAVRYDELAIRYGRSLSAEADASVSRQLHALHEETGRTIAESGRFREGGWYFAGREVSR